MSGSSRKKEQQERGAKGIANLSYRRAVLHGKVSKLKLNDQILQKNKA